MSQCEFCGGTNFSYAPGGRKKCVSCADITGPHQTEFSAQTLTDGIVDHIVIRAENGSAGYTSYWRREQIEDYGLVEICGMVERAMWRANRALRKSMQVSV